jgi:hypothetical protein
MVIESDFIAVESGAGKAGKGKTGFAISCAAVFCLTRNNNKQTTSKQYIPFFNIRTIFY